jgi:NTE family protein
VTTAPGAVHEHGFRAYVPLPRAERRGLGLCFSGGGYRAALFHAGAVRRLNELGILSQADTITSVSGGSIMTAQLATYRRVLAEAWPAPGEPAPRFEEGFAEPLRRFTRTNIRTRAVLRRLLPTRWFDRNTASDALAARYANGPAPGVLRDLPERPRFVFLATDITHREQWHFDAGRRTMGRDERTWPAADWPLARAAAASSCLPGAFTAMKVELDGEGVELTDGGIYDNLGLEPVWRDHAVVLVSDAAPSFAPDPEMAAAIWRGLRYAVTLLEQATDVRKRWLISNFILKELAGAYWGIASRPSSYGSDAGYPDGLIDEVISQVRIDLDPFSDAEIAVLENHGYLMADVALARHASELGAEGAPPARAPHPDWLDEAKVRRALADSHRTNLFKRGW